MVVINIGAACFMENNEKYKFVNISDRVFESIVYDCSNYDGRGFKPAKAFWGALESEKEGCFSEWDEMYGECYYDFFYDTDLHISVFSYYDDTFVFNPACYKAELINFYKIVEKEYQDYTDTQIRDLFINVLKKKNIIKDNIKYLVCQVDIEDDQDVLEEAFTGFNIDKKNSDEVFIDFDYKVRRGIMRCFSGIEVTNYALGRAEGSVPEGIYECEMIKMINEPRYGDVGDTHLGLWDVHSVAIFDTNSIKILNQKIISMQDGKKR